VKVIMTVVVYIPTSAELTAVVVAKVQKEILVCADLQMSLLLECSWW